ncbi:MAG: OB-fold domain-containing protein [Acidobacteriota bacterium]|nr:OB-fold domain-containing protein [Acidobacteriota bacterium]
MIVYTETVVHLAPPAFAADVPYQVIIVTREDGTRVTGRVEGDRVEIGDTVTEAAIRDGVPYFRKSQTGAAK